MRQALREIWGNTKYVKKYVALFLSLSLVSEIAFLGLAPLVGKIIDTVVGGIRDNTLFILFIAFFVLATVDVVSNRFTWSLREYIVQYVRFNLLKSRYADFFQKDYQHVISLGTGKVQTRIEQGIDAEISIFQDMLRGIVSLLYRGFAVLIILLLYLPLLNLLLFLVAGLVLMINKFLYKKLKAPNKKLVRINESVGSQTTKMVMEYSTILFHNQHQNELRSLDKKYSEYPRLARISDLLNNLPFSIMEWIFRMMELLCYIVVGYSVIMGDMTVGTMVMLATYVRRSWWPIQTLLDQSAGLRKNVLRYTKMRDFLAQVSSVVDGKRKYSFKGGAIELDSLSFAYPKKTGDLTPILSDFSLHIPAGKTTALVGPSGSGKSTLIKLLMRLYDPQSGRITIDGQNLRSVKRDSRYKHVGYVTQEPAIIDGTVRENMMYAIQDQDTKSISDDEIWKALELGQIDIRIKNMEKGLDTPLGEKGVKLSGGEKQRLALARLFLKNPEIVILDEPSAALDSESEHAITQIMKKLLKGRTTIIIAHRLQTVMHANKIIVLEKGKIIQSGTHKKLIAEDGLYARLVDLQSGVVNE